MNHDYRRLGIKESVLDRLTSAGYAPQLFFEAGLPRFMAWNIGNVVTVMRRCVGAIVLGFPRWRATVDGGPIKFIGEFSHIEGAVALSLGLPTLITAETDLLERGIVYKAGGNVVPIPADADRETIFTGSFGGAFDSWMAQLGGRRDVFLGFCSKSAGFAAQVEQILTRAGATVHNWAMDFGVGFSILDEITAARMRCDRAVFIFSEDDPLDGTTGQAAPRDNVVFETGFFISAKGPGNTLIIRVGSAKMPADLGGAIYLSVPTIADGPAAIEARLRDFAGDGIL